MNESAISIKDVALDYPRKKKGVGLLREFITGRFKKIPRKDRWFRALNGINLEVKRGEVVGIMGQMVRVRVHYYELLRGYMLQTRAQLKLKEELLYLAE